MAKVVGVGSILDDDDHVESEIGLYALGVLSEADDSRVLTHLIRCASCRALSDDLGDAAVFVSMLGADDLLTMHSRPRIDEPATPQARARRRKRFDEY